MLTGLSWFSYVLDIPLSVLHTLSHLILQSMYNVSIPILEMKKLEFPGDLAGCGFAVAGVQSLVWELPQCLRG